MGLEKFHEDTKGCNIMHVFDRGGSPKLLSELLASGGEGGVYPLADRQGILVKLYHKEILEKRGSELSDKIEAMIQIKGKFEGHSVSWPLLSVFNDRKEWIGYAMHRADGVPLGRLAHAMAYKKSFPNLNRSDIVNYLLSLLKAVQMLHKVGVRIGDYNFNNILCLPGGKQVTLIDCDSYQMERHDLVYPCPVGSPDMTPKEHHGKAFDQIFRSAESERFSIAIILFKCLMLGRHPYDIVGGEDPVTNLREGRFAYGRGNTGIPSGAWYNIWSHMPSVLKSMFIETFTEGSNDISKRPTIENWIKALTIYLNEINKGWHEINIKPENPKSKEYRGSRSIE